MEEITLEALIKEFRDRIPRLRKMKEIITYYKYDDMEEYENWLATTKRFLRIHYPNDKYVSDFEEISNNRLSEDQQRKMLAILIAIAKLPTIVPQKTEEQTGNGVSITTNFSNTNTQSQNQEQSLAIDMFLEAIKDDLTGKQIKELREVLATSGNDEEKARSGIIEKLKSFGSDVAANIVANILTNPIIGGGL
jgi:hypothetical protein